LHQFGNLLRIVISVIMIIINNDGKVSGGCGGGNSSIALFNSLNNQ